MLLALSAAVSLRGLVHGVLNVNRQFGRQESRKGLDLRPACGQRRGVNQKLWAGLGVVALLVLAAVLWLGRYELQQSTTHPVAWRLDRWTGQVDYVPATTSERVWRRIHEP